MQGSLQVVFFETWDSFEIFSDMLFAEQGQRNFFQGGFTYDPNYVPVVDPLIFVEAVEGVKFFFFFDFVLDR